MTAVDIVCVLFVTGRQPDTTTFASNVPVSNGQFSATAVYSSNPPTNCRLRAIPNGVDPSTDYLGAYTGPILYTDAFGRRSPRSRRRRWWPVRCSSAARSRSRSNITPTGTPTGSTVKIDGHNAYLPSGVHNYLTGTRSLSVTQSALTVTHGVARNGDMTITERR